MNYSLNIDKNSTYDIMDNESEVLIKLGTSKEISDSIMKNLKKGSGFNGFTPDFFGSFKGIKRRT